MKNIRIACVAVGAIVALCIAGNALALPAMDVPFEVLMAQGGELKQMLNLNPNQQILWRQSEARIRSILDDRRRRRERLQSDLLHGLDSPNTELRDLAKSYDVEAEQSHLEDRQMRELFLTVNDALNDTQRQAVLHILNDQLLRVADRGGEPGKSDQPQHSRGMGHQRPGGSAAGGGGGPPQQ
ncbi:MAG TPA: hypothetical protein VIF60_20430 [Burkholderiaceae bacterium]|jgi:hypothetical protein